MADVSDLVSGAGVVRRSFERSVVHWCAWRSGRRSLGFGGKEVSKHTTLLVAAGGSGQMWSDCCV